MNRKIPFIHLLFTCLLAAQGSATFEDRCGIPGVPVNGAYKDTNDSHIIEYVCADKQEYRLIGNKKRRCQANGTWDSPVPRCEPNLFYKMSDIHFRGGSPMMVTLWENLHKKTGTFAEIGPEAIDILIPRPTTIRELTFTIRGMPNAANSDVIATIRNQTSDPGYNCKSKKHQINSRLEVVHLECPAQTAELVSVFSSGPELQIFEIEIYGSTSEPEENCGTPDIPANGYATVKAGTVNYTCNQGFKLVGKDTVTCKGGQWSDQAPVCTVLSPVISVDSVSSAIKGLAAKASSVTYIQERDNYPRGCLSGPTFWCSNLKNAKSCKAVNHCIQTVWSRTVVSDDTDDVCHACKDMIQKVKSALLANSTSQDLRLVFETSCKLIPVKLVKEECLKIVDQFIPDILEMMAARMNPLNVCSSIGLCNSNWVDQILAEYAGARKEPSRSTKIEQCEYCRYTVNKVQNISDTFVFGKILELCSQAGSFADTCVSLLMDHFDEQYKTFMDSLKGVDVCSQFHYCYAFDKSEKPKSEASSPAFVPNDDIQCEFCENMVKNLRDILVTNTTEAEFKIVLQSLCKQTGAFEKQCLELIDQYHASFYNFLVNGLNPKETCRLLALCPNPGLLQLSKQRPLWNVLSFPSSQEESEEVHIEKAADSEEDGRLNYAVVNQEGKHSEVDDDIDVVTLGGDSGTGSSSSESTLGKFLETENVARDAKPEKTGAKAANTSFCLICEYAMNELDRRLSNASTEAEIRQTVDNLCAYLPNSVAEMCITFIDKYGDDVYQLLLQKLVPKAICLQIGLCLSSGPSDSIFIPYEDVEEIETVDTCDMCQIIVDYLDRELEDDTIEESLDRIVERACNLVPASSQTTCKAIVDTYGPYLISELGSVADKHKVCEMFHLCKTSDPEKKKRQLLGEEKCTWGPSHWCSSVENAKSCNALEHCQKKVWLKAEP